VRQRSRAQVAELAERLAGRLGRVGLDVAADEPAAGMPKLLADAYLALNR
jgi:hypothetical protein